MDKAIKTGDIILTKGFCFAKVTDIQETGRIDIMLADGTTKELVDKNGDFTFYFSDDNVKALQKIAKNQYFNPITRTKGEFYANRDLISAFSFDGDIIKAKIKGTHFYETSVSLKTGLFDCSCPVNGDCKHEYALITYLIKSYEDLLRVQSLVDENKNYPIDEKLVDLVKGLLKVFVMDRYVELCRYIYQEDIDLQRALKSVILKKMQPSIKMVLSIFAVKMPFDDFYNAVFENKNLLPNFPISNYLLSIKTNLHKITYECPWEYSLAKAIIFQEQSYFFDLLIIQRYEPSDDLIKNNIIEILEYFLTFSSAKNNVFKAIVHLNNKKLLPLMGSLTPFIDDETIDQVADLINKDFYPYFSLKQLLNLFIRRHDESIVTYVIRNLDGFISQSEEKTICYFCVEILSNTHHIEYASNIAKKLPHNSFIFYLINNSLSSYYTCRCLKLDTLNKYPFLREDFYYYFKIDFEFSYRTFNECFVEINGIKTVFDDDVLSFEFDLFEDKECSTFYPFINDDALSCIASFIHSEVKNNAQYIEKMNEYKEIYEKAQFEKENKVALALFDSLEKQALIENVSSMQGNAKVRLECHFTGILGTSLSYYGALDLKVGINRMYSTGNIPNFLHSIEENIFHKYGKELAFYHSISNFKEKDQKFIEYLLHKNYSLGYQNKTIKVNDDNIHKMLFALKGNEIFIDNDCYYISDEDKDIKIKIENDFNLSVVKENDEHVIIIGGVPYLINDLEGTIHFIKDSKIMAPLLKVVLNKSNIHLDRLIKQFNQKVYCYYANHFEIDEEVLPLFKQETSLTIYTYFDFDKSDYISVESKYFKDDVSISESDISETADHIKFTNYQDTLSALGVKNHRIERSEDIFHFLYMDFTSFKKISEVFLSETLQRMKVERFSPPKLRMKYESEMMSVLLEQSMYSDDELFAIMKALRKKKNFVRLKGDKIIQIDDETSKRFFSLVDDLGLNDKHLSYEEHKPIYQSLAAFKDVDLVELDDLLIKMVDEISSFKKGKFPLPDVKTTLRTYQKEAFQWLRILTKYQLGGILADDMGLGKTLEIISLISSDLEKQPSLIVAPKSLVFNWVSEFNKFSPSIEVKMIYGNKSERESIINKIKGNKKVIYLSSYDSLRSDIDLYRNIEFNYLILDEAQAIKNNNALKTQSVKTISSKHRFALSGTPIENDIFDLWSIFDFLMPRYLPSLNIFKSNAQDQDFQDKIAKYVAPFILRRTKGEVLKDLPHKFERVMTAEMSKEQRKIYDAHILEAKQVLQDGGSFAVLPMLTRLRQICVDPKTFIDNYEGTSGKFELLKELLDEYIVNGHRMLLFSQFVSALNIVENYLKEKKIKYLILTGDTDGKKRLEYVNLFNSDEDYKVFLISLKAGGNGLNLVGADTVIHYDPWWNVAAENQASDRAHRIGQTKTVEVIKLIAENSIEQRVIELQNHKKDLVDRLISDNDSSITHATYDDLKFILD